jgi:iron complex transport system ATP-binding protein
MKLEVENITIYRNKKRILHQISFQMNPQELTVILGANGAGKSTLLEAIGGELPYQSGHILLEGKEKSEWAIQKLAQSRAFLRQSSTLNLGFTVEDLVLMGRSPHMNRHETHVDLQIVHHALEMVGLQNFEQRIYTQLSGGEQQRVHLARVLAQVWIPGLLQPNTIHPTSPSPLLLLDEPTSSLDLKAQHQVLQCALRFIQAGGSVLCILHDLNLAAQYADRLLVLSEGQLVANGSVDDVLHPHILKQAFNIESIILRDSALNHPIVVTQAGA